MLRRPELASLLLPLAMLAACAASTGGKGTEDGLPGGGKADGFTDLVDHGALRFGASSDAEIAKGALFHAWTFDLSDNADVSVRTEKLSTNLDTVMYLYRRSPGASSWGSYIAKNDDAGGSAASKVQGAFEPGEYRVVVKSFKDTNLGTFSLFGECAGAGCPASGPFGGQCDESTPRSLPSPTGYTENCTHSLAYLLNAHVVSQSKTTVELGSQCSGDPVAALAAEYYMGYWQDIGVWEDYIEGADPVELEVETTSLGEDGYIVSADFQWGDETALSFVFNGAGDLLAYYQHNQSPDVGWFCGSRSEAELDAPSEDCVRDLMYAYPHLESAEVHRQDSVQVGAISEQSLDDLPYVAQLAATDFAYAQGLGESDVIEYEFTSWNADFYDEGPYANVTFTAPDGASVTVMVGSYTEDQYFEFGRSTDDATVFHCATRRY